MNNQPGGGVPWNGGPYAGQQPYGPPGAPMGPPPVPYGQGGFGGAPQPPPFQPPQASALAMIALVVGIVAGSMCLIGLIPCVGWLNWGTIIVAPIGKILGIAGIVVEKDPAGRTKAIIGLCISLAALIIGSIRLVLGAGCV